ncbi:helix-turn-helix domain-containing protein [Streptomyces olivaceus]|uniref:helix-turn-helix domain-containing protein n=1 Tax=Streptomyces olivaceus TaxID=47716 RepID=UPI00363F4734
MSSEVQTRSPRLQQGYRPRVRGAARRRLARSLKADYDAGATIRSLADERSMSYGTVRLLLLEAKTTLRGRGGRAARR